MFVLFFFNEDTKLVADWKGGGSERNWQMGDEYDQNTLYEILKEFIKILKISIAKRKG